MNYLALLKREKRDSKKVKRRECEVKVETRKKKQTKTPVRKVTLKGERESQTYKSLLRFEMSLLRDIVKRVYELRSEENQNARAE